MGVVQAQALAAATILPSIEHQASAQVEEAQLLVEEAQPLVEDTLALATQALLLSAAVVPSDRPQLLAAQVMRMTLQHSAVLPSNVSPPAVLAEALGKQQLLVAELLRLEAQGGEFRRAGCSLPPLAFASSTSETQRGWTPPVRRRPWNRP